MIITDEQVDEVVQLLADGKFVNAEAFSIGAQKLILVKWRKHPNHPNNQEKKP